MKRRSFIQTGGAAGLTGLVMGSCSPSSPPKAERKKLFTFIHFTDVHIQPEKGRHEGFLAAIERMNSLKPDFVIGGGDLIGDALGADESRAVAQYDLYLSCIKKFQMPVHNVMGNHEIFGINVPDEVSPNHPQWGKEMFKKRLGDGVTYGSFDYKGVHFLLLDSVEIVKDTQKPGYREIGGIGKEQMEWLVNDLGKLAPGTPVIAVSHIPMFTLWGQMQNGPTFPTPDVWVITDGKPLFDLLSRYRLIGFFSGHMHINELYAYKKMQFINTGAVCGNWWTGPREGHPEGFNLVTVWDDGISAVYVSYGWDASKYVPKRENSALWHYSIPFC
jgi:3',5'-cyclic-AMP phosphodiesterase